MIYYRSLVINGRSCDVDEIGLDNVTFGKLFLPVSENTYHGTIPYIDYLYSVLSSFVANNYIVDRQSGETFPIFQVVPCGKCRCCREKRFQEWKLRCVMESQSYDLPPLFFTLTYEDMFLPPGAYLNKTHIVKWKKRFLKLLADDGLPLPHPEFGPRLLVRGEYGSKYDRPHYHVLLWNYPCVSSRYRTMKYIESVVRCTWHYGDRPSNKPLDISYSKEAGNYVMRYLHKEHKSKKEKDVPSFILRPCRPALGRTFFTEKLQREYFGNPQFTDVVFVDKFTQKLVSKPLPVYFKNIVFPSMCRLVRPEVRHRWKFAIDSLNTIIKCYRSRHLNLMKLTQKRFHSYACSLLVRLDPFRRFIDDYIQLDDYRSALGSFYRSLHVSTLWRSCKPILDEMLHIPSSFFSEIDNAIALCELHNSYRALHSDDSRSIAAYASSLLAHDRSRTALEYNRSVF